MLQGAMKMSRVMFMKHRDGYMLPVYLNVNSFKYRIVAVIQKLKVSDQFIWFYSNSWTVCAATHESFRLLGVSYRDSHMPHGYHAPGSRCSPWLREVFAFPCPLASR